MGIKQQKQMDAHDIEVRQAEADAALVMRGDRPYFEYYYDDEGDRLVRFPTSRQRGQGETSEGSTICMTRTHRRGGTVNLYIHKGFEYVEGERLLEVLAIQEENRKAKEPKPRGKK
jgi:hypothetical protein